MKGVVMKHLIVLMTLGILVGHGPGCIPAFPKPKFQTGQMVKVRLGGEKVQILRAITSRSEIRYECRVEGLHQNRRDGILSADTEIVRYAPIIFNEFELELFTE